jgi:adenine-specific DNA-methyltransferase
LPFPRKRLRVTIANNAEIDVIWDKWRRTLEPLRIRLNATLGKSWEEWEVPREASATWSAEGATAHSERRTILESVISNI